MSDAPSPASPQDAPSAPLAGARSVTVVGAGPAGLMAAEVLARAGVRVTVHERMPSPARKLLMAGRGGLNLTHSEDLTPFLGRYGDRAETVAPWLEAFSSADLIAWAEGLGQTTFVGSSGRVFPRAMKASPLVRAWLMRLNDLGVTLKSRSRWTGWSGENLAFETPEGAQTEQAEAVVLALGGASWPRLGSDGAWTPVLEAAGCEVAPLKPANAGFNIDWSPILISRAAGQPLKKVALSFGDQSVTGDIMLTAYGLEGGAVYALSGALRDAIERDGSAILNLDLRPDLSIEALAARLDQARSKDSFANLLRKAAGLSPLRGPGEACIVGDANLLILCDRCDPGAIGRRCH